MSAMLMRSANARALRGAQARSVMARPSVHRTVSRCRAVHVKAFFNFLKPQASSAKSEELVEELIDLVSTRRASVADVQKLASELQPFGVKSPVRSKLLFGTFKLVYTSKAGASAGARQVLEEPDRIREVSDVKVLGLLPGVQTAYGELNGVDGDSYEEVYDRVEVQAPVGGENKQVDIARLVQVVFLDAELKIVRVKEEGEGGDGALLVYQRVSPDGEEDEEEEEGAGKKQAGGIFGAFGGGSGNKEGTATIAEREVLRKMAAAKGSKAASTPRLPANLPSSPAAALAAATKSGTQRVQARSPSPPLQAAKPDPKANAEAQRRDAEAKAKAKEAAQAKEKAEVDKRAASERQSSIKALLEQLTEQLKDAQAESREAAKEAKDLERANATTLKQVAGARQQLRSAADEVDKVEQSLEQALSARAQAEQALKQALASISEAKAKAGRK